MYKNRVTHYLKKERWFPRSSLQLDTILDADEENKFQLFVTTKAGKWKHDPFLTRQLKKNVT